MRLAAMPLVACGIAAAALAAARVPPAAAEDGEPRPRLEIRLEQMEAGSGYLWMDFSLLNALEGTTRKDLRHGRPLTFVYTVEVWRERSHWFDALISSRVLEVRLRYDPWQEIFAVAGLGSEIQEHLTLEEADAGVSRHLHVRGPKLSDVGADARFYVVIRADIRTLTLHDLGEVEGWLRGEVKADADRESGLSIPRSFMRMLLGVSGLGDRSALYRSDPFPGSRLGLAP